MYLHEKNRKDAEKFIVSDEIPSWSVAKSTKTSSFKEKTL